MFPLPWWERVRVRGIKKDILTFDTPQLAAGRFINLTE
jgi:hypothetical protein